MRKTKIIATLGPATSSPEMIGQLIDAGMNIARLNMSHAPHDWVRQIVKTIRDASKERECYVGVLMDTQGPAIRTGDLSSELDLQPGQNFTFTVRGEKSEEQHSVDVNYEGFVNDISVGDIVLVDNGEIHMKVLAKHANKVDCEVLTPGTLGSRRHINLPGVKVNLPPLTEKDKADIKLGLELQVDFVALSFVREASDLRQLRQLINDSGTDYKPKIVAKVEDQEAVKNFDAIALESDAIMVARGDLGIEVPYEELPIIQRKIVKTCHRIGIPVIVATHMLESMIENPLPTRAEITDVANAVFEQADAIMLSGETTVGKYPVKCIEVFDRIATRIERSGGANFHKEAQLTLPRQKVAKSAVGLANQLEADAIIVFTVTGNIARYVARHRPECSAIWAFCNTERLARTLSMNWGVKTRVTEFDRLHPEAKIYQAISQLVGHNYLRKGNTVVIITAATHDDEMVDCIETRVVI